MSRAQITLIASTSVTAAEFREGCGSEPTPEHCATLHLAPAAIIQTPKVVATGHHLTAR
jgi:hypothetical protein